jgi:acyl carrier protein
MSVTEQDILAFVLREIRQPLTLFGVQESDVGPDFDLLGSGVLDSMRFVDLLNAIEREFDIELDMENLDIEEITLVRGLIDAVTRTARLRHG